MHGIRTILSWALALFLIAVFLQSTIHVTPLPTDEEGNVISGSIKFFDRPGENIVFATLADRSGYAIFEPTGRVLVGVIELIAAFFLLIPFTRRFGAILAFLILAGAVAFHLSPWLGTEVPTSLSPDAATDGGQLFYLALATLIAAVLLIVVHPGRKRLFD